MMMRSMYIQLDIKSINCYFVLVSDYCGKPVTHPSKDEYTAPYIWSFYHAFFFSFTVCSTVGNINIFSSVRMMDTTKFLIFTKVTETLHQAIQRVECF